MSRSRRGLWPFLLIVFSLFLLLYRLHPTHDDDISQLESLELPEESNILHPGDFVDPAGYPDPYIVPVKDKHIHKPDGEGTLHDIPKTTLNILHRPYTILTLLIILRNGTKFGLAIINLAVGHEAETLIAATAKI
ncbi:uncharacterized protein N7529_011033 [Penicillium soppii]|uniref:uncharacterized protein n=1 Tax=Penicillium soppii TaxID=69789 RepID=UPI0025469A3D|nr:uncharacterized protein N7529_011033 [Penicillium soppii]KAJ5851648.1 hypothetical protein N7529_011033 [Penicillium soppii]